MNWIQVEGTLEALRQILDVPGVEHLGRGVRLLADGRYQGDALVEEAAIPLIAALDIVVTVLQTQADIDNRLAQVESEQKGIA